MLRRGLLPVLLLLALALGACGAVRGANGQPTLSVSGTGSVSLAPDIVTVSLGVQTQGSDVARAVADNNRTVERVMGAVREAGVAADDMRTTYFSVSPQQQYDPQGMPTGVVSYWVDNTLTVTLRQTEALGSLLQAALEAGANSIHGVSYGVHDTREAEVEARTDAMEDARERAELLAAAAGATLGDVISISTSGYAPMVAQMMAVEAIGGIGGGGPVPVMAGSTQVEVQVFVVYELR